MLEIFQIFSVLKIKVRKMNGNFAGIFSRHLLFFKKEKLNYNGIGKGGTTKVAFLFAIFAN